MRKKINFVNFNNYSQTMFNKYSINDEYLQSRKQKRACLNLIEKIDEKKNLNEKKLIKRVAKAYADTPIYKRLASSLSALALLATLQSEPLLANSNFNQETILSQNSNVILDEDSFLTSKKREIAKVNDNISLHLVSHKAPQSEFKLTNQNSVIFDDDSDISYTPPILKSLTVIDTSITDWEILKNSVKEGEVLLLDSDDEPLETILTKLKDIGKIDNLNIISHGSSGKLNFQNRVISSQTLEKNSNKWQELGSYLNSDGDILLYGCNVAKAEEGKEFINKLASLTNADIGASINPTGNSEKGGDWTLEVAKGKLSNVIEHLNLSNSTFKNTLALPDGSVATTGDNSWTASGDGTYFTTDDSDAKLTMADGSFGAKGLYVFDATAKGGSHWIEVSADGTNLKAFELDSVNISEYKSADVWSGVSVVGYVYGGGTKTKTVTVSADFTSDETIDLNNVDFNGVYLSKFRVNFTASASTYYADLTLRAFSLSNATASAPSSSDSDGDVTAGDGVTESSAINIPTTAASGSAVEIFDFIITDGGTADATDLTVTSIDVSVSGTDNSKLTYILDSASAGTNQGSDLTSVVTGTNSSGTVTFNLSGENIVVANGTSETYVVKAFFNDTSSITDNTAITVSIDGDTDLTVSGTTIGTTTAINNSGNAIMTVTATDVNFTTEPAGSVSGVALTTQPIVKAIDAYNNVDVDYTGNIVVSKDSGSGTLSGTVTKTLSSGVATFTDVNYTATADQESFTLTATSSVGAFTATSNSVTSDVVATKLKFTTEPSPTSVSSAIATTFSTVPIVKAVDANDIVDVGYSTDITLAENGSSTTFVMSGDNDQDGGTTTTVQLTPSSGVATFTNLQTTYTGSSGDTFTLQATSGSLTSADSGAISVTAAPATPTNLIVKTVTNNDLNVSWTDASTNETGFKIYSSTDNSTYELNQSLSAGVESHLFSNIPTDMQYYFKITAYNGDGENNTTAENNVTAPTAPTSLTAVDYNSSQINLNWTDASSSESGYKIYSSTTNGSGYSLLSTENAGVNTYSAIGLDENITYYFEVVAYNSGGESNTSTSDKTNDIPNFTFLTDPNLSEDFGSDTTLTIADLTDSDSDDINLSVENNDSTLITFSKSWGDVNLTSANYNTTLTLTLTSEANKSGVAEFNLTAYDGKDYISNVFNVTVNAVNDTPYVVNNTTPSVTESTSENITSTMLSASDPDNNTTLTYTLTQVPSYGTLTLNGSTINTNATFTQTDINNADVNYTHTATSTGDGFKFTVKDQSESTTTIYDFNLTIIEVNDVPTFDINMTDINLSEDSSEFNLSIYNIIDQENADLNISVESNDSSILSYTLSWGDSNVTSANYGNKDLNISIIPVGNANGTAELNVTVWDGVNRISKEFNVTLIAVNDTPTIDRNNTLTVIEKQGGLITTNELNSSDIDNNTTLFYTLVTPPTNGDLYFESNSSAIVANEKFTQALIDTNDVNYTHNGSATTSDSFVFNVSDQSGATTSPDATFKIIITEFDDPPTYDLNMTKMTYAEDSSEFNLSLGNIIDQENADLNISIESNDSSLFNYTLSWGDGNITNANYNGKDFNISFVPIADKYGTAELNITVWDGTNRVSKDFNVTLSAVNDLPTSANATLSTVESRDLNFTSSNFSFSDVDGDSLIQIKITSLQSKGNLYIDVDSSETMDNAEANLSVSDTVSLANLDKLVFEPVPNEMASPYSSFGFKVHDGTAYSASEYNMTINVTEVNDPATYDINMSDINVSEDFSDFNISLINISDPENRDLNITVESNDSTIISFTQNWTTDIINSSYTQDLNISFSKIANKYGIAELNVTVDDGVNKTVKDFNITIIPVDDNPTITAVTNVSKDMNFSEFNLSLYIADVDLGDLNLSVDINDSTLIDINQTWYDLTNEYNLTSSEYNTTSAKLNIKSKPNVEGIVRFTLSVEDNQSGEVNTTFDLNVSAYPLVLADLNAISLSSPTTTSLTLPSSGTINSSAISWSSSNSGAISDAGAVTQSTSDTSATLTASASLALTTLTKDFTITVTGTGSTSSGGSSGGGSTYVAPVTTEPEPTVEEPVNDVVVEEEDTIIIIDGDTNEEVVVINEVETDNQIETYGDFKDNTDGTNTATVDFVDGNGDVTQTEIKTDFAKEDVTITSTDTGVETIAQVNNEDGSKTESKTKVNNNGTMTSEVKTTDKDGNEVKTKISSTKVGTNVEMGKDGSLKTSFKDNHGMEVKAVATAKGGTEHEIDITDGQGNIVKTIATSNVKGSSVVIKEDGTVQTSAKTTSTVTNADGSESNFEVLSVVEADSEGKATHLMQVKDSDGNAVITKASSEILGATTTITEAGVETTATATTTFTDNSGNTQNREVEFKVQAKPNGQANHKLSFKDENGDESITEATSEVEGATTIIKTDNTIETKANVTDNQGNKNEVVAQALSNGNATHSVESKDENGDSVKVEATSELPNTKTVIKDSGVETSTTTTNENNEKVDILVTGTKEGYAEHQVTVNENSRGQLLSTRSTYASSQIKGAKTLINKSGLVQTSASLKNSDGSITKAIVDTRANGESFSYFKKYNRDGNEIEIQPTTINGNFELGNNAIIKEQNGKLLLDVTTKVSSGKTIEF